MSEKKKMGRPIKYQTDEERREAKRQSDRIYYLKNREKYIQYNNDMYRESIDGKYIYKSKCAK